MISKKEIKEIVKRKRKKISHEAYVKLDRILFLKVKEYLNYATINADMEGRKIIKARDFNN